MPISPRVFVPFSFLRLLDRSPHGACRALSARNGEKPLNRGPTGQLSLDSILDNATAPATGRDNPLQGFVPLLVACMGTALSRSFVPLVP